ncbi:MAG: transposase [Thermoplasmatales archaeon]
MYEHTEKELHYRISMMHFLGFPETIPDSRTIWLFRERLSSTGKDKIMWKEIWEQFKDRGISIRSGTIQDATFIESDPGKHGRKKPPVPPDPSILSIKEKIADATPEKLTEEEKKQARINAAEKRSERREERKYSRTRRSKDGTWAVKNKKAYFFYKLHTLQDAYNDTIINYSRAMATFHYSQIDLSIP